MFGRRWSHGEIHPSRRRPAAPACVQPLEPRCLMAVVVSQVQEVAGTPFQADLAVFGPGDVAGPFAGFAATVDWGDGSSSPGVISEASNGTYLVKGSHVYAAAGTPTVTVTVSGTGGTTATGSRQALVAFAAPAVTARTIAPFAGVPFSGAVGTFATQDNAATASAFAATIEWGDSRPSSVGTIKGSDGSFTVSGSQTYTTAGSFPTKITVVRLADGGSGTDSGQALVGNPALTAVPLTIGPAAGLPFREAVATFKDNIPNTTPAEYAATIDWGDGSPVTEGAVGLNPAGGFRVSGTHTYADAGRSHGVRVQVRRLSNNATTTVVGTANVVAAALQVEPPAGALTASAGSPLLGTVATIADANSSAAPGDYVATVDWGDGSTSAGTVLAVAPEPGQTGSRFVVSGTHSYAVPGSVVVRVTVRRPADGREASASKAATVAPLSSNLTATGTDFSATAGLPVTGLVATFVDSNSSAAVGDYAATIDWGDGTSSAGVVSEAATPAAAGKAFQVGGTHTYASLGSRVVQVTIRRLIDGREVVATSTATVARPTYTIAASAVTATAVSGVAFSGPVATFTTNLPASAAEFAATIAWGDGTTEAGTVVASGDGFAVVGTHAYLTPGVKTVTVTIQAASPATQTTGQATVKSTIVVGERAFSGGLDPAGDTGVSNTDGITRINQPTLTGIAEPFSVVQVSASRPGQPAPFPLGATIADASGRWSLQVGPLAHGAYQLSATVTPPTGSPVVSTAMKPIVVDTVAPRVVGLSYDRRAGRVQAVFRDDLSGMDLASLRVRRNYNLISRVARRLASESDAAITTAEIVPTDPQAAVVTLVPPAARPRPLTLRILSGGVADVAGNPLDGGNNFVVSLASVRPTRSPAPFSSTRTSFPRRP